MRQMNIALDLYSGVISFFLVCYMCLGRAKKDKMLKYFILICIFNIGIAAGDITNWAFEGHARLWYPAALWAGSLLFYMCTGPMLLAFVGYVIESLSPRVRVSGVFWYTAAGLCAVQVICSVLSLWNGMYFTVGEGNRYHRGNWFWLSQLLPILIYTLAAVLIFRYRRQFKKKDLLFLMSYILLPLIAELIQIPNYGIALLNTSITLSILLIFINIQLEREIFLQRQEKELAESRIDIMLSQIQPHFLYNALTVIRRLCDIDPKQAKEALREFSIFLRMNMKSLSSKVPIPFAQELIHAENYLRLEQKRFQDRLCVMYEIGARDFLIPPLTLQPIVENAVRHGILRREEGGMVVIRAEETKHSYIVTVTDNGIGFQPGNLPPGGRNHIGIDNVRGRLTALCNGTLDIESAEGVGTTVVISIPKKGAVL